MLTAIFFTALAYVFWNGLHDAPVILAQVTSTRSMGPRAALALTWVMELSGALFFSRMVLKTMSFASEAAAWSATAAPGSVGNFVLAALAVALAFNIGTWYFGIPSSSTHALFGAMTGAALALNMAPGFIVIRLAQLLSVLLLSAILGGFLGLLVTSFLGQMDIPYRAGHLVLAPLNGVLNAGLAFLHGANDVPKSLGLFLLALHSEPPSWWSSHGADGYLYLFAGVLSLGILFGENRILKLLGTKIFRLRILHGLGASLAGCLSLGTCTALGFPVSSTQILVGSMLGAGAAKSSKSVRWMVVGEIMLSWIITLPACAIMGYGAAKLLAAFNF